ncbi:MAG: YncE family protein [Nitrospirae bacterium]|nr:YncE family protein [Nitrospirota bacterium]
MIPVGKVAWYIAIDSAKSRAYVTRREENIVSVIDTNTDKVIGTIDVGKEPIGVAVDSENNRVYVANHGDISVSVIDSTNNKVVDTIKLTLTPDSPYAGSPWGIIIF